MRQKKIIIVDDEKQLVSLVRLHMETAGYEVLSAKDGEEAMDVIKKEKPDLVILDLMIPKIDGWEVCKRIREGIEFKNTPVIILTARTDTTDKLKGFECGADDYVTKPFSPRELVARVKRVMCRMERSLTKPTRHVIDDVEIDLSNLIVKARGKEVYLTEKERAVLKALLDRQGEFLSRGQLLDTVWSGDNYVEYGNVDVHIRHLREKLEKDPENPKIIKSIKGAGYSIEGMAHV